MAIILIIEDNKVVRENTAELLELEGYEIIVAKNGKDGLEKMENSLPDLVVCDMLMPEMDGLQLLAHMGNSPHLKTIPLIFFSAKSEKKEIKNALDNGAYDYIVKPSDLEDLISSIQRCLLSRKEF
ncbi:CheY-like chemotaxis protein [Saonia flava]|uniref:CheY-like chemotaxis protein n=1 Tax=Saonia flava TaxID=523696 RepID=A0A846QZ20_9FLAO|nr:response regulator [Saonia flava]NJB70384.1 CheY-like chemotaxis protein [Saonia flava]